MRVSLFYQIVKYVLEWLYLIWNEISLGIGKVESGQIGEFGVGGVQRVQDLIYIKLVFRFRQKEWFF